MSDEKAPETPELPNLVIADKLYNIVTKDKTYTAKAKSIAWTENAQFILLMNGEDTKHVIVAANVIAVTEQ